MRVAGEASLFPGWGPTRQAGCPASYDGAARESPYAVTPITNQTNSKCRTFPGGTERYLCRLFLSITVHHLS